MARMTKKDYGDLDKIVTPIMSNSLDYGIEIDGPDGDFSLPPVLDIIRFIENPGDLKMRETITRRCILGKRVQIFLNGKPVDNGFISNNMNDPFDTFESLRKNPLALMMLMELAGVFVLKKSNPLLTE